MSTRRPYQQIGGLRPKHDGQPNIILLLIFLHLLSNIAIECGLDWIRFDSY